MRTFALVFALSGLAALSGCSDEPPDVLSCDITDARCQQAIFSTLAARLGISGAELPPVRVLTVSQYESLLRLEQGSGETPRQAAARRALALFDLVPQDEQSGDDEEIDRLVSSIAAYYCPPTWCTPSNTVTIIDRDYEPFTAQVLLAHEFMHALQEQQFGFAALFESVETEDAALAGRSLIEGDAEFQSIAWALDQAERPLDMEGWSLLHQDAIFRAVDPARNPMTPFFDSVFSFPYGYGFDFMTDAGLAGIREPLFDMQQHASLAFMLGYDAVEDGLLSALDEPLHAHPAPPIGQSMILDDRFGAWYVFSMLARRGAGFDAAWGDALRWLGDRFEVWEGTDGNISALWRVRYEDVASAQGMASRFGEDYDTTVIGSDVLIVASESPMTRDAWAAALSN